MQEEMKCPTCGGHKFKSESRNTFKCVYCGCIIAHKEENKGEEINRELMIEKPSVNHIESNSIQQKEAKKSELSGEQIIIIVVFIFVVLGNILGLL